jgi:hypothetical protein
VGVVSVESWQVWVERLEDGGIRLGVRGQSLRGQCNAQSANSILWRSRPGDRLNRAFTRQKPKQARLQTKDGFISSTVTPEARNLFLVLEDSALPPHAFQLPLQERHALLRVLRLKDAT